MSFKQFNNSFVKRFRQYEGAIISRSQTLSNKILSSPNIKKHPSYIPNLVFDKDLASLVKKSGLSRLLHFERGRSPGFESYADRVIRFQSFSDKPRVVKCNERRLKKLSYASWMTYKHLKLDHCKAKVLSLDNAALLLHGQSSAGYGYWKKKSIVKDDILSDAKWFTKHKSFSWLHFPMTTGFRVQQRPQDYFDENSKIDPKCRLFFLYSGVITLFELQFHGVVDYLINKHTAYFTGKRSKFYGEGLKLRFKDSSVLLGSDLSGYDATINNDLIISSFLLIELSHVSLTADNKRMLINLCKYFAVSNIWCYHPKFKTPNLSFTKYSGCPSGSVFTNMIDTFAHFIFIAMYLPQLIFLDKVVICGDDILMDISSLPTLSLKVMKNLYSHEGLVMSDSASKIFKGSSKFNFLGHIWIDFTKYIHVKLAINNMVWHSEFDADLSLYQRVIARSVSILQNGKNGFNIFKRIFPDLIAEAKKKPSLQVLAYYNKLGMFGSPLRESKSDDVSNSVRITRTKQVNLLKCLLTGHLES